MVWSLLPRLMSTISVSTRVGSFLSLFKWERSHQFKLVFLSKGSPLSEDVLQQLRILPSIGRRKKVIPKYRSKTFAPSNNPSHKAKLDKWAIIENVGVRLLLPVYRCNRLTVWQNKLLNIRRKPMNTVSFISHKFQARHILKLKLKKWLFLINKMIG